MDEKAPAKRSYLIDAALIGLMVAAMFYAPHAQQLAWLPWSIASSMAGILAGRGVDLGSIWAQFAWLHNH